MRAHPAAGLTQHARRPSRRRLGQDDFAYVGTWSGPCPGTGVASHRRPSLLNKSFTSGASVKSRQQSPSTIGKTRSTSTRGLRRNFVTQG